MRLAYTLLPFGLLAVVVVAAPAPEAPPVVPPLSYAWSGHAPAPTFAASESPERIYTRLADRAAAGRTPGKDERSGIRVDDDALSAVVRRVCVVCHNDQVMTASLSLQGYQVADALERAEVTEKMITKLRLDMMPPPGIPRPRGDTLLALVERLEEQIDLAVAENPNPGVRPLQRMNRAEYERTIRTLLGLEVDASAFLPPETISDNFDNIADVQGISATLLEGYMRAATHVARLAVGDLEGGPRQASYKAPRTTSQMDRVEGAPYGSRGGISVTHVFPADGEYVFRLEYHPEPTGFLYGQTARGEMLEVSVDGERVALLEVDRWISESDADGIAQRTPPIFVRAGQRRVSAVFIPTFEGPVNDLLTPPIQTMADTRIGLALGVTTVPHLRDLFIVGPYNATGISETESRRRIFTCRPTSRSEEAPCAESILRRLASEAYRRPLAERDVDGLMALYREGARNGGFEAGVRLALTGMLASPHFVFRFEHTAEGANGTGPRPLDGPALATRLSYFLWALPPDRELRRVAESGELVRPEVLREQALRMLVDPRAEALATRFASQWLRLQRLEVIHPDARRHPEFDDRLRESMRRETELFFYSLVREDRSLLEFFEADYTYVNEQLARHYGIPGVSGSEFRKVAVTDDNRKGLFGQASVLTLTSHANRTSPVDRGLWIMEVILGSELPPPPPNVADLELTSAEDPEGGRALTVRERMEIHRQSPTCNACHQFIDPLGLPLENFDVTGLWRTRDDGNPLDSRGELWDGTQMESPQDLRRMLLERPVPIARAFTENLMRYALGRRLHYFDKPTVRQIARDAGANEYRMSDFILGVVMSDAFRMRGDERVADTQQDLNP